MKEECITNKLQKSQLNPNTREDSINKLRGRLQNADVQDHLINPILLFKKDTLVRLTIEDIIIDYIITVHLTHSLKYETSTDYLKETLKLRKY